MQRGVYIGRKPSGDFDLISTGDYINPLEEVFKLRDLKTTINKQQEIYLIINDLSLEFLRLEISGSATTIRMSLSENGKDWFKELTWETGIYALGTQIIKPIKVKFSVDDYLEYFSFSKDSSFKEYKLRVMYV